MKFEDQKRLIRIGQVALAVSPFILFALINASEQNLIGDEKEAITQSFVPLLATVACIGAIVACTGAITADADLRKYKNFLAVAAKLFVEHEMEKESVNDDGDETKALLKDHLEVLSNKESLKDLGIYLFDNLNKEEQTKVFKILTSGVRAHHKIYDFKVKVKEIVNIFIKHADENPEFKKGLYVKMLRLRYDTYVKQHQAANAKPALTL